MTWVLNNWQWLLAGLMTLASVVGTIATIVTRHYGEEHPGLKKALSLVADLCSILTSRGSPGLLKFPFVTLSRPPGPDITELSDAMAAERDRLNARLHRLGSGS